MDGMKAAVTVSSMNADGDGLEHLPAAARLRQTCPRSSSPPIRVGSGA